MNIGEINKNFEQKTTRNHRKIEISVREIYNTQGILKCYTLFNFYIKSIIKNIEITYKK